MTYYISATHEGKRYPSMTYMYYSKREAIKRYKEKHGLTGKHNVIITVG